MLDLESVSILISLVIDEFGIILGITSSSINSNKTLSLTKYLNLLSKSKTPDPPTSSFKLSNTTKSIFQLSIL